MKKTLLFLLLFLIAVGLYAQQIEKIDDVTYKITGDHYVATTSGYNGGYIQSFVVDGIEFEDSKVEKTKGNYFFYGDGNIGKPETPVLEGNKLTLKTDVGTMVYDFYPDRVEITASDAKVPTGCFFILDQTVRTCKINGEYKKAPLTSTDPQEHIWLKGRSGIKTSGDCHYWGPWFTCQVIDFSIAEGITKKCVIAPYSLSEEDIKASLDSPLEKEIVLFSPKNYEVFQRSSKTKGSIIINGIINKNATDVSYRITGKDLNNKTVDTKWKQLKTENNGFDDKIEIPAGGWYKLELKYKLNNEAKTYTVENVGIGEIILGAGQSNSTNCGQFPIKQESGMVVSTDGVNWQIGDDPQIGVHDGTGGGSYYPALGDILYEEFKVPIAIASTGWGGTTVAQWQPEAEPIGGSPTKTNINLFDFFMHRVAEFGPYGFRCVLWHQGEGDFFNTGDYYFDNLSNVIWQSRKEAGWNIPWFTAQATYIPKVGLSDNVREGQKRLWDMGVSFKGADTDTLLEEYRDYDGEGIHFSPKGLKKHAELWAEQLIPYIHSQID